MKPPEPVEVDTDELSALRQRVASGTLAEGDSEILQRVITAFIFVSRLLEAKNTSIRRLRKMLFGSGTEKASNVLDTREEEDGGSDDGPPNDAGGTGPPEKPTEKKRKKRKGHGRNGAAAYTGADREKISHQTLQHKDPCPECPKGKVYVQQDPGIIVRVRGAAPVQATVYELQRLRCNLCGAVFTARAPDEAGEDKYDDSARAMVALLKYGVGFPFNRIEKLQQNLGVPVPSSTLWDQMEEGADKVYPAHAELLRQAAQGEVIYNDDTTNRVLELHKENKTKDEGERTGIFTTGIVSTSGGRKIAIFHTGRRHAGENLQALLEKRETEMGPPIQMADALSRNTPKEAETLLASCLVHARRNFVDVAWAFPDECRHVIEALGKVYRNDEVARKEKMSAEDRLRYHQERSGRLMADLNAWLKAKLDNKEVEPNSGLGKAIKYMLNHWEKLTLFLRVPGAPLDNNAAERILKRVILHRKNALFYRSQFGAHIGDMYMSLIHTCSLMKANPFDYLVALQKYTAEVRKAPSRWMPWNFERAIASLGS
ncbi:MAG: IS66 family transposase [Desulfobacterales bacterium]|nr:IS66 family transposase [Desulfobacterales bacterium]